MKYNPSRKSGFRLKTFLIDQSRFKVKMYILASRKFASSILYLLVVCIERCIAYPNFQLLIPNGEIIPHPCKPNYIWKGVGHQRVNGGGERNSFGRAFDKTGKTWTRELCQADSDGDGLTNGQELGDPSCVWTKGAIPNRTTGLSHPGVCQPFDSAACANKTDQLKWVNCNYEDFKCDAINNTDTKNVTIRLPVTRVPAIDTTYMCMTFDLPSDKEYHLIAIEPVIDNANIMHHMLLFGCKDVTHEVNQPYPCGMSAGHNCSDILGLWSVGLSGQCFNEKAGFRIGQKGFRKAAIQVHWNNPELQSNYNDSSGIILYYTETLRQYDAGIFLIGQTRLNIPPGKESMAVKGGCPGDCMATIMSGPVYVTAVYNHMHYLGVGQSTSVMHIRGKEETLADDEFYSYDSPVVHIFADPVQVNKSDSFTSTCIYKSTSRSEYTYFGEATRDEMCLAFIWYYPKENITANMCTSYANISDCDWTDEVVEGCSLQGFSSVLQQVFFNVTSVCSSLGQCKPECISVANVVKQQPCFKGSIDLYFRDMARITKDQQSILFYKALDSCDEEIMKENICHESHVCAAGIHIWAMSNVPALLLINWLMFYTTVPF